MSKRNEKRAQREFKKNKLLWVEELVLAIQEKYDLTYEQAWSETITILADYVTYKKDLDKYAKKLRFSGLVNARTSLLRPTRTCAD